MASEAPNPDRERLRAYFSKLPDTDVCSRWDDLWIDGTFLPFDRHMPNPALDEALSKQQTVLGASTASPNGKRKMALVPGCGRGYDVNLLAAFGYDAVGLEISKTAAEACEAERERIEKGLAGKASGGENDLSPEVIQMYRTRDENVGRGTATFVVGDFFANDWTNPGSKVELPAKWDLVYDYTFLSALPPGLRPKWAARMRDLVQPAGGRLLCVEFPTYKDPKTGGPPWSLPSLVYVGHLGRPGKQLDYDEDGNIKVSDQDQQTIENGKAAQDDGMVRLAHWKAEKTHEIGKGTDHIGIWRVASGT